MSGGPENCKPITVDFIAREGDEEMIAVEDEIRKDLALVGITANVRFLNEADYLATETSGDYNMLFTRTWGAPYDPHSYLSSWAVPSHVEYSAIQGLEPPLTRDSLVGKIEAVQKATDPSTRTSQWHEILNDIHQQAIFLPLWGTRIPYVVNRRLSNFEPSNQAFTYPLNTIKVVSGSTNVTVAPGSSGALFQTMGPINPHQYAPNEIFASDWVYEGLVKFGQDGVIVPGLAVTWQDEATGEGHRWTFQLRQGVKFHDGSDWNCTVAKLNFDHVLSDVVRQRHQWYGTGKYLSNWTCDANNDFVLETSAPFYPLLQELTYSRPLVFASAESFAMGIGSDPDLHNSCEAGKFGSKWNHLEANVTCLGLKAPIGTGPLKFVSRDFVEGSEESLDKNVIFARHDAYWGEKPGFEFLEVRYFENATQVEAALRDGTLDMVLGQGPLTAAQVASIKEADSSTFDVRHSEIFQHSLVVLNSGRVPTNDIEIRRTIIHAINKASFIESEFGGGLEEPVSQLLPPSAPYCNVDLNPKWSYDFGMRAKRDMDGNIPLCTSISPYVAL